MTDYQPLPTPSTHTTAAGPGAPLTVEPTTGRHFTLIPDHEFAAFKPPAWLVDQFLTEGGLSVLYGPSGTGKTFVALDLAYAIARGIPWHGYAISQCGPVLYIAAESGHSIAGRMAAYRAYHKLQRFQGVYVIPETVRLTEMKDVNALLEAIDLQLRDPA